MDTTEQTLYEYYIFIYLFEIKKNNVTTTINVTWTNSYHYVLLRSS